MTWPCCAWACCVAPIMVASYAQPSTVTMSAPASKANSASLAPASTILMSATIFLAGKARLNVETARMLS